METPKRKRGTGPAKRYGKALVVYLTQEDLDDAHEQAARRDMSASAYLRGLLREAVKQERDRAE